MEDIYKEILLEHYRNPRNKGKMSNPDVVVEADNPLCGDRIKLFVKIKNNRVNDLKFEGQGCVVSLASASILFEDIKGKTIEEVFKYNKKTVIDLLGIRLGPNRLKCALLPLEAVHKALKKVVNS